MAINTFMVWSWLNGRVITIQEEAIIFFIIFLLYSRVIFHAIVEVLKSLLFFTSVKFEHVFWIIQTGVII